MERHLFSNYLRWLSGFTCLILLACAVFNWRVDPYDLFGSQRIQGINALKPAAETRERFTKPYRVDAVQPRTLILGNSRPEIGIDPSYSCWPKQSQPVYNLAMLGSGLYSAYRNLQHAVSSTKIEHLLLGLDFLFFTYESGNPDPSHWEPPAQDFEHLRVLADGSDNPDFAWQRVLTTFKALFSLQTAADSIHTLAAQSNGNARTINPDGHNPGRQFLDIIAAEGQQVLFAQKNREVAGLLSKEMVIFQGGERWSQTFEILRRILDIAKQKDIRVTLIINPRHADFLNLVNVSGKWNLLDEWKRALTELTEEYGAELWDFQELNAFSTPPPPEKIGQALIGFWEPGHYRSALGDLMIDSIFSNPCDKPDYQILGRRIHPDNIDRHLDDLRQQLLKYVDENPNETRQLDALFDSVAGERR